MEKAKQTRDSHKTERNASLLKVVDEVMKSYGDLAPDVSRGRLYKDVGDRFHLAPGTVRSLMRKQLKEGTKRCQMSRS